MWAIAFNFIVGMFLFLPFPGWQSMVGFLVSAVVISYTMGPVSLLCFRKKLPEKERTFRLPLANIACFLAFYFCNLMFYWTGWGTISKLIIALIIGFALFFTTSLIKKVPLNTLELKAAIWLIPYLLGMAIISYYGSFGGLNKIGFGYDFLLIGIFSLLMLYVAVKVSSTNVASKYAEMCETI
jgi:amino acid transporter